MQNEHSSSQFDAIAAYLNSSPNEPLFFGLIDGNECHAVMEVIDTKRGTLTKLLALHLSPNYWEADTHDLATVYTAAIVEMITLGESKASASDTGNHDIKICGRNNELLSVLKTTARLMRTIEGMKGNVQMEGRWLRITF